MVLFTPEQEAEIKRRISEGKNNKEISDDMGVAYWKVSRLRRDMKRESRGDSRAEAPAAVDDVLGEPITVSVEPTAATEATATEGTKSGETTTVLMQPPPPEPTKVETIDMEQLRRGLATGVVDIEGLIFKAVGKFKINEEEKKILRDAWVMILRHYIKTGQQELAVAAFLLLTAHGGIIAAHYEEMEANWKEMDKRRRVAERQYEEPQEEKPAVVNKNVKGEPTDEFDRFRS